MQLDNISLALKQFDPGIPDIPVLDLDGSIPVALNRLQDNIQARLAQSTPKSLFGERDKNIQAEFKNEIITYLNAGKVLTGDNIVFGFGSYSILERIATKLLNKGVMIGHLPQFRYFPMEYILNGGQYSGVWNQDLALPFDELMLKLNNDSASECLYINNPVNPTGQVWDHVLLLELIETAARKNTIVIVDEVYGDLLEVSTSLASRVNEFSNLIVVRSLSKIFGLQNLRIGYMIAGPKLISQYEVINNWDELTNLNALVGIETLRNKAYRETLKKDLICINKAIKQLLLDKNFFVLDSNPLVPLLYINKATQPDLEEYFRQRNIKAEGSKAFSILEKKFPSQYARIRVPMEMKVIEEFKARL